MSSACRIAASIFAIRSGGAVGFPPKRPAAGQGLAVEEDGPAQGERRKWRPKSVI
jgi:hypothetical protein